MNAGKKTPFPIALVISLCVNAALIGGAVALVFSMQSDRHHDWRDDRHGPRGPGGGPIEEQLTRSARDLLSPEDRQKFREQLSSEFRSAKAEREELQAARIALMSELMADEFDRDATMAAFDDVKQLEDELRARLRSRVLDMLGSLPDDQRKDMIRHMMDQRGKHKQHSSGKGYKRKGPPPEHGKGPPPPKPFGED